MFCRVESGVREQDLPAAVTPADFQTQQGFAAGLTPKLARTLEPALMEIDRKKFLTKRHSGQSAVFIAVATHFEPHFHSLLSQAVGHVGSGAYVQFARNPFQRHAGFRPQAPGNPHLPPAWPTNGVDQAHRGTSARAGRRDSSRDKSPPDIRCTMCGA
jgi:hypothetical protein